ncbi:uncharacterized protein SPSK_09990 [Sporothrix schenckii 1099-18]|uniref:Uncharacterized protein n=1 Tax=Sporothrix schenckii 1099-18 TaxID=1397361 RepID=A0A0F2M6M2_SPOSC|nr:uncharacterized protein SPSK_09990 [Sporothrix schenckii 1099-18]KJR84749.1 hypothetical protein SPSK_09990 [Sporothrix schenckii 1099-18]
MAGRCKSEKKQRSTIFTDKGEWVGSVGRGGEQGTGGCRATAHRSRRDRVESMDAVSEADGSRPADLGQAKRPRRVSALPSCRDQRMQGGRRNAEKRKNESNTTNGEMTRSGQRRVVEGETAWWQQCGGRQKTRDGNKVDVEDKRF